MLYVQSQCLISNSYDFLLTPEAAFILLGSPQSLFDINNDSYLDLMVLKKLFI